MTQIMNPLTHALREEDIDVISRQVVDAIRLQRFGVTVDAAQRAMGLPHFGMQLLAALEGALHAHGLPVTDCDLEGEAGEVPQAWNLKQPKGTSDLMVSDPQIWNVGRLLGDALRAKRSRIPSAAVQFVLKHKIAGDVVTTFRALAGATDPVRRVEGVDRKTCVQKLIDAAAAKYTGRNLGEGPLADAPSEGPQNVELVFFHPSSIYSGWLDSDWIRRIYAARGLVPDPRAQIAYCTAHPEFARQFPNCAFWYHQGRRYIVKMGNEHPRGRFVVWGTGKGGHPSWLSLAGVRRKS
jgi:hypothetical protein